MFSSDLITHWGPDLRGFTGLLNSFGCLICDRLLAPRLQTGEVLGYGHSCMCAVQCCGNSAGAP